VVLYDVISDKGEVYELLSKNKLKIGFLKDKV